MGFGILLYLLLGCISGWVASLIVRGRGLGLVGNMAIGVAAQLYCRRLALLHQISLGDSFLATFASGIGVAALALFAIGLLRRRA